MARPPKADQLSLRLPLQAANARDDLVVTAANQQAVAFMDSWPNWDTSIAILAGPVGAGKTHLANIWATRSGAVFTKPGMTANADLPDGGNVIVEDLTQGNFSEAWLFHLVNAVRGSKSSLVLTSRRWPGDWGIALADLQSRLRTAFVVELSEPDDALLTGTLTKLFADRQLLVEPNVVSYLVVRMERSLASAQKLVEQLDKLSLASQRGVTKPLAAEALQLQRSPSEWRDEHKN